MKKMTTSLAISAALISGMASADVNPFGATELPSAYLQLAETEMACGANMKMEAPKDQSKEEAEKAAQEKAAADEAAKKAAPKH